MSDATRTSREATPRSSDLGELALSFLRLGVTAFGGPAAHVAMMEDEFVRRRKWLTREELLDLVGAAGLIPGPSSTEVAIYIGHRRAGWRGLLVAGACFILPAALIVTTIAWFYVRYGALPAVSAVLYGIEPVIVAIVVQALVGFARTAIKSRFLAAIAAGSLAASITGAFPLAVLACAGAANALVNRAPGDRAKASLFAPAVAAPVVANAAPVGLAKLFFVFLKFGAIVFGSGYVLLAFLRGDLVDQRHWLGESQLVDAVAVGQLTPGPVFTTATFIGYLLAGLPGAAVATLGIFLPSFVLVAASARAIPKIRASRTFGAFLDGVNVASVALMAWVSVALARTAIKDFTTAVLALASLLALWRWKPNSAWLILAGGATGGLAHSLR